MSEVVDRIYNLCQKTMLNRVDASHLIALLNGEPLSKVKGTRGVVKKYYNSIYINRELANSSINSEYKTTDIINFFNKKYKNSLNIDYLSSKENLARFVSDLDINTNTYKQLISEEMDCENMYSDEDLNKVLHENEIINTKYKELLNNYYELEEKHKNLISDHKLLKNKYKLQTLEIDSMQETIKKIKSLYLNVD